MFHSDIKIYSFYYQPNVELQLDSIYEPLWAGKNNATTKNRLIGDDTGDHISNKNKYYSELTGLYWVWKNTHSKIVGSCHYRRYFTCSNESLFYQVKRILYFPLGLWKKRYGLIYTNDIRYWQSRIISEKQVIRLLSNYDAILPIRRKLKHNIKEHYRRYHNLEDLILVEQILEKQCPEYVHSFNRVLEGKRMFANNMFILNWDIFDRLMNWLFSILFEFEKQSDISNYKGYQERIFGFLSERLITLWIVHNKINYTELPLIYFKKLKPKAQV